MSGSTLLYAWTVPAFSSGSPVDHTWITTYDNRVNPYPNDAAVVAAQQNYWYCWGSFHPTGGTRHFPTVLSAVRAAIWPWRSASCNQMRIP